MKAHKFPFTPPIALWRLIRQITVWMAQKMGQESCKVTQKDCAPAAQSLVAGLSVKHVTSRGNALHFLLLRISLLRCIWWHVGISTLNFEHLQDDSQFCEFNMKYAIKRKHTVVWNTKNSDDKRKFQTEPGLRHFPEPCPHSISSTLMRSGNTHLALYAVLQYQLTVWLRDSQQPRSILRLAALDSAVVLPSQATIHPPYSGTVSVWDMLFSWQRAQEGLRQRMLLRFGSQQHPHFLFPFHWPKQVTWPSREFNFPGTDA